jgi:RNA polymerase sigma factor (sigma-70 family)
MPPPPAEQLASRILLGPALRAQPDRRLVRLVREGYEAAFEEIVRRYRKPLDRFAAAIVGGSSEDVTQDAFSKALLALRGSETEIELRPWLYRIVRNTALNDLRDRPAATEELGEAIPGRHSVAVEAERREEMAELMKRLRSLPEPQRAAIVMRELEGLSHGEIATALGVSGGAARQAIFRARAALRDGLGLLVPLPLLRTLFDHGAEAVGAGGAVAAGAASAAGGGGGGTLGVLGAGGVLKAGLATALIAGSLGAGVAMQQDRSGNGPEAAAASAAGLPGGGSAWREPDSSGLGPLPGTSGGGAEGNGSDDSGHRQGGRQGSGGGDSGNDSFDDSSRGSSGSSPGDTGHGGRGPNRDGHSGSENGSGDDRAGEGTSAESRSGRNISDGGDSGSSGSGDGSGSGGSGGGDGSLDGSSGGGGSGSGSGDGSDSSESASILSSPAPTETASDGGEPGSGSGSGDSGSNSGPGSSGSGSAELDP